MGQSRCSYGRGSVGVKGNVLDAIREEGIEGEIIYSCGPTPMLRALKVYAEEKGIEAQISLEEKMACGREKNLAQAVFLSPGTRQF